MKHIIARASVPAALAAGLAVALLGPSTATAAGPHDRPRAGGDGIIAVLIGVRGPGDGAVRVAAGDVNNDGLTSCTRPHADGLVLD